MGDLFPASAPVRVEPGASLFRRGEPAGCLFVLTEGLVKLTRCEGGREVIVSLRQAETLVGAPDALLGGPYSFDAVAVQTCHVRRVQVHNLKGLTRSDPDLLWTLVQNQIVLMRDDLERAIAQGCLSSRQRLARLLAQTLAHQSQRSGAEATRLHLPVRRWELAQMLAMTPEHLSRTLKEMESDGLIQRRRGWVYVSDLRRLVSVADGSPEPPAALGRAPSPAPPPPGHTSSEIPVVLAATAAAT